MSLKIPPTPLQKKKLIGKRKIFCFSESAEKENFWSERRKRAAANWINQTCVCVCDLTSLPANSFLISCLLVVSPVSYRLAPVHTAPPPPRRRDGGGSRRSGRRPGQLFHPQLKRPFDVLRGDGFHSARGRRLCSLTVTPATAVSKENCG